MSDNSIALAGPAGADRPLRGIALVAFGISIFSLQDVVIRALSGDYSVLQIMFIRALVALWPMLLFVRLEGGFGGLKSQRPLRQFCRGFLMVFSYTSYYMALAFLPLATVTSIFFVSPLIVTIFSVVFLGETVGARRWCAVLIGFSGMLIIVRPGAEGLEWATLLPIVAALTYAGSIMFTRKLGRQASGASMAFYAMLTFLAVSGSAGLVFGDGSLADESHASLGFLLRGWQVPSWPDLGLMAVCGGIAAVGFYCLSQGYRVAQASLVAPFEYIALPFAISWGLLLWDEVPSDTTFLGIALIVGGGLYALHREARRNRYLTTGRGQRLRL